MPLISRGPVEMHFKEYSYSMLQPHCV